MRRGGEQEKEGKTLLNLWQYLSRQPGTGLIVINGLGLGQVLQHIVNKNSGTFVRVFAERRKRKDYARTEHVNLCGAHAIVGKGK